MTQTSGNKNYVIYILSQHGENDRFETHVTKSARGIDAALHFKYPHLFHAGNPNDILKHMVRISDILQKSIAITITVKDSGVFLLSASDFHRLQTLRDTLSNPGLEIRCNATSNQRRPTHNANI